LSASCRRTIKTGTAGVRGDHVTRASLFAFQILLGVVFGIWGLALALPLMAVVKVVINFLHEDG
jgi:hypothetical protein